MVINGKVYTGRDGFAGDLFLDTIKKTLRQYLMEDVFNGLEIRTSQQDVDPVLLGASVIAFDNLLQSPSSNFKTN